MPVQVRRIPVITPAFATLVRGPERRLGRGQGAAASGSCAVDAVAHRGASAYAPENTLAAIRAAVALNAGFVEVDVHRTKDGALVLMHDATLNRTTDVERVYPRRASYRVADFTLDEIQRLDAGQGKGPVFHGERVPTLADAAATLQRTRTGLLLEVKCPELYPGIERDLAAELAAVPGYVDDARARRSLVVQSFDHGSMLRLRRHLPEIPVGLLGAPHPRALPRLSRWADQVNPHHRVLDRAYVAAIHAAGMRCQTWTVDRAYDMRRAIRLGVDGVITNRPDVLAKVLEEQAHPAA